MIKLSQWRQLLHLSQSRSTYILGRRWCLTDNEYGIKTQDERYCDFVNDVQSKLEVNVVRGIMYIMSMLYVIC